MVAALFIDGTRQDSTVSIDGGTQWGSHSIYGQVHGTWMGMLDPGSYTFKVRYRAGGVQFASSGSDWAGNSLQVLQL